MTYREAALRAAVSQLGVTEHPPNSNWGPEVSGYLEAAGFKTAAPWCMAFVHWCYRQAGFELGGGASVGNFEEWAKQHGDLVARPERGDIVCYRFDSDNWPDHVGIVESVSSDKSLHTIEGNTGYGNDANGGQVMRRVRPIDRCSFARIPGSPPPPKAKPKPRRVDVLVNGRLRLRGQKPGNPAVLRRLAGWIKTATVTVRKAK